MLREEVSVDMDRITQLQDGIIDLLTISSKSIEFLTTNAPAKQTNPDIPILTPKDQAKADDYATASKEFVADLISKAKEVDLLIRALPVKEDVGLKAERLDKLQAEIEEANAEYKEALDVAESLLEEISTAIHAVLVPSANGDTAMSD